MVKSGASFLSTRFLLFFPAAYAVHLLDERFYGEGTAAWSTAHAGIEFSNPAWWGINLVSFLRPILHLSSEGGRTLLHRLLKGPVLLINRSFVDPASKNFLIPLGKTA